MPYLIFAVLMAAVLISLIKIRSRPDTDPSKSVASFSKAIKALDPARTTPGRAGGKKR